MKPLSEAVDLGAIEEQLEALRESQKAIARSAARASASLKMTDILFWGKDSDCIEDRMAAEALGRLVRDGMEDRQIITEHADRELERREASDLRKRIDVARDRLWDEPMFDVIGRLDIVSMLRVLEDAGVVYVQDSDGYAFDHDEWRNLLDTWPVVV